MSTQLRLDLTPRPSIDTRPNFDLRNWLDVSAIAVGVGFDQPVFVSLALSDVFEAGQSEADSKYDQRLYDALWYAHFEWSLNDGRSAHIAFTFPYKLRKAEIARETSLRLHIERRCQGMFLGLLKDF
jgi:hypothetical protein